MLFIEGKRNGYSPAQCGKTMTVGELVAYLQEFPEDEKVYLRNDRGYTYGSITQRDIELDEAEAKDDE